MNKNERAAFNGVSAACERKNGNVAAAVRAALAAGLSDAQINEAINKGGWRRLGVKPADQSPAEPTRRRR